LLYGRRVIEPPSFRRRLAVLLLAATLLAATPARAQPSSEGPPAPPAATGTPPLVLLFGVAPDSRPADLYEAAGRVHADCRPSSPVKSGNPPREALPVVCVAPPSAPPVSLSATYWYEDDALARAFLVAAMPSATLASYRARFNVLHAWIARALGPPTEPLRVPPGWSGAGQLPEVDQMGSLLAGRVRLSIIWQRPEASIELWLAGERGQPVLAVGMRRNRATAPCASDAVASALLDLFPPASAEARAGAARTLAACRVGRAAGALRATLDHDETPAV
jgi:hypothetical protein